MNESAAASNTRKLTIATIATQTPMGAQAYQEQVISRASSALEDADARQWTVRRAIVRSVRSPLPGNRRLPMKAVANASPAFRRHIGRLLYAGASVTHRMSLELPPAPSGDVITLHDVVAWRFPDESDPVPAAREEARRADAVICVSEFSATEAVDLLGIRDPHVIYNGVDRQFYDAQPTTEERRVALGLPERYVLHAGGASQRKNLAALAAAWPMIQRERPDLHLLLVGPPSERRTALFRGLPSVHLAGRVRETDLPGIMAAAQAVVVPSLYEGFGLPVLEAMAANVPVVIADTSSLAEVSGGAGILVPPTARGIVEGTLEATSPSADLSANVRLGRERAGQFTWERSALAHARVWASVS